MYSLADIPQRKSGDKPIGPVPAGAYRVQILKVDLFTDRDVSFKFDFRIEAGPFKNRRMFPKLTWSADGSKAELYGQPRIADIAAACGIETYKTEQDLADQMVDKTLVLQVVVGKPYTNNKGETKTENEVVTAFTEDGVNRVATVKCPSVSLDAVRYDNADVPF